MAPAKDTHDAEDIQEKLVTNTSSVDFKFKLINANIKASVPLLQATANFLPVIACKFFSRNSIFLSCSFCIELSKSSKYSFLYSI